jgi:hypothetical protein
MPEAVIIDAVHYQRRAGCSPVRPDDLAAWCQDVERNHLISRHRKVYLAAPTGREDSRLLPPWQRCWQAARRSSRSRSIDYAHPA